jgi:hypothetical protein
VSTCEGHCGVAVTDAGRETVDGYTTVVEHTVGRCRLLRTLREAGQRAVGSDGTSVVVAEPHGFLVRVSRMVTEFCWYGYGFSMPGDLLTIGYVVSELMAMTAPLDVLGRTVEDGIRAGLARPPLARGTVDGPLLARDPYAGGSS